MNKSFIKNLKDIKESADMQQIIGRSVELKRKGRLLEGCCPFHKENTPSFKIDEQKWTCYGACSTSGDIFDYIMKLEGCTFYEAVEKVAQYSGQTVDYINDGKQRLEIIEKEKKETVERSKMALRATEAADFYHDQFISTRKKDTVKFAGRTYKKSTAEKWLLGLAKKGNELFKYFSAEKADKIRLKACSLINKRDSGEQYYDYFKNRYLFPIRDHRHFDVKTSAPIVGFGARAIKWKKGDKFPKYLNSKESILYRKHKVLYGLYENRRAIGRDKKFAYVFEGYTDVLTAWEAGIENCVASCGTALTIDHARQLKRYTNYVVVVMDGDAAGRKAALKSVEPFIEVGMKVSLLNLKELDEDKYGDEIDESDKVFIPLPDGQGLDPDEFIRKYGADLFKQYADKNNTDGVIEFISDGIEPGDPFSEAEGIKRAALLLSKIKDEDIRKGYMAKLCAPKSIFYRKLKQIESAVTEKLNEILVRKTQRSAADDMQILKYGFYKKGRKYYSHSGGEQDRGKVITNFTVKPIMAVADSQKMVRLLQFTNEHKESKIVEVLGDSFASLNEFQKVLFNKGNFFFFGSKKDFTQLSRYIFDQLKEASRIFTMGSHKNDFFTFGNGLIVEGKFHAVNSFGLVNAYGHKYYLPAFSQVSNQFNSDDDEDNYEFQKKFIYTEHKNPISYKEWGEMMVKLFGGKGMYGAAYLAAALFRDHILKINESFPLINAVGPAGSGKTFFCRSIMNIFQSKYVPPSLPSSTNTGILRTVNQGTNLIFHFDEYKNFIHEKTIEALKTIFDGGGAAKGKKTTDNQTTTQKAKSTVIYSGQEKPTKDNALHQRSVSFFFEPNDERTDEESKRADTMRDWGSEGRLKHILIEILPHRELVVEHFAEKFRYWRSLLTAHLLDIKQTVSERSKANYLVPLAVVDILKTKCGMELPFDHSDLFDWIKKNIIIQEKEMNEKNEVAIWWNIFAFLIGNKKIYEGKDFMIETIIGKKFTSSPLVEDGERMLKFSEPKQILFLRMTVAPGLYEKEMVTRGQKTFLKESDLKSYLKLSKAYIGQTKQRFVKEEPSKSCWAFDLSKIPVEIGINTGSVNDYEYESKVEEDYEEDFGKNPTI